MVKKAKITVLKKGERCRKGWTSVEVKVGRRVRRVCVRGKVVAKRGTLDKITDGIMLAVEPVIFVSKML